MSWRTLSRRCTTGATEWRGEAVPAVGEGGDDDEFLP